MKKFVLALIIFTGGASSAAAQANFNGLRLYPGDKVYVVDTNGDEVGGHVTTITNDTLRIGNYEITAQPGMKIERKGDSLANGVAIGAGTGLFFGYAICGQYTNCVLSQGITWGLFGALIDWAHVGRTMVFRVPADRTSERSLSIAPVVSADRKGVGLSLSF